MIVEYFLDRNSDTIYKCINIYIYYIVYIIYFFVQKATFMVFAVMVSTNQLTVNWLS